MAAPERYELAHFQLHHQLHHQLLHRRFIWAIYLGQEKELILLC